MLVISRNPTYESSRVRSEALKCEARPEGTTAGFPAWARASATSSAAVAMPAAARRSFDLGSETGKRFRLVEVRAICLSSPVLLEAAR